MLSKEHGFVDCFNEVVIFDDRQQLKELRTARSLLNLHDVLRSAQSYIRKQHSNIVIDKLEYTR